MIQNLLPMFTFVFVTTFTPGPNNISSASMGMMYGYFRTVRYLAGIAVGFFFVMLLSATVSSFLQQIVPAFEPALRWVGAAYILYLAYGTLKTSYTFDEKNTRPLGFGNGLLLQILNPKVIVYGLTLFSAFLAPVTHQLVWLFLAAILLAMVAFCATSTWTFFGASIRTYLSNARVKRAINAALALLLIYTALELSGAASLFH